MDQKQSQGAGGSSYEFSNGSGLPLDGPDKAVKTCRRGFALRHQRLGMLIRQILQPMSKVDKVLGLIEGPAGDVQEVEIIAFTVTGRSLRDVGGNRVCRPAQLAGQPIQFFSWKSLRRVVNSHGQIVSQSPSVDFRIVSHIFSLSLVWGPRSTVHGPRSTVHGPRSTVNGPWSPYGSTSRICNTCTSGRRCWRG